MAAIQKSMRLNCKAEQDVWTRKKKDRKKTIEHLKFECLKFKTKSIFVVLNRWFIISFHFFYSSSVLFSSPTKHDSVSIRLLCVWLKHYTYIRHLSRSKEDEEKKHPIYYNNHLPQTGDLCVCVFSSRTELETFRIPGRKIEKKPLFDLWS